MPALPQVQAKTTVGTKDNLHTRPLLTDSFYKQLQNGSAVQRRVNIGWTKIRNQKLATTEYVQRQKAVTVVIAVRDTSVDSIDQGDLLVDVGAMLQRLM